MFISHKYRAIFVHIQRTGGNSVQRVFAEHDPDLIEAVPVDPAKNRTKHCFASDIRAAMAEQGFTRYTKFCVVRNPYERMVSWYFHLTDQKNEGDAEIQLRGHKRLQSLYSLGLKAFARSRYLARYTDAWIKLLRVLEISEPNSAEEMALRFGSIGELVKREVAKNASTFHEFLRLPRDYPGGIFERFHANQLDYISDGETVLVDKVLRFESLPQEFGGLAHELGFPGRLPHVNQSSRKSSYREYYDSATSALLGERFQRDCKYFGYDF
jgi:Sulfotransferase family